MEKKRDFNKDFDEWYSNYDGIIKMNTVNIVLYSEFYVLPKSMQWGVYVDFFDSVKIQISLSFRNWEKLWQFEINISNNEPNYRHFGITTRKEAREKALEKAIEIFEHFNK